MNGKRYNRGLRITGAVAVIYFAVFLAVPVISLLLKSFAADHGVSLENYVNVLGERGFLRALGNSFLVSAVGGLISTILAFFLAYTIQYTNVWKGYKRFIGKAARLPMLLPTITYGFAIIYSFGKQGLLTRLFGHPFFEIYGFTGLLMGMSFIHFRRPS